MAESPKRRVAVGGAWTGSATSLVELAPPALIDVRGRAGDAAFDDAVASVLGAKPPTAANRFVMAGDVTIAWLGPDQWLIIAPAGEEAALTEALASALDGLHHAVTDVSGGRSVFRLTGEGARDLLAAGSPFDFHPRRFGPGDCAQTVLARTTALILQRDAAPTYDVLVRRSFARYLWDWLTSAALSG